MMNFRTIQILTVFLLVCEIQGFDPNYTETCKCKCHGDVCELDHYCDQSTKKCTHCRFRFGDCFTPACEPCCESFCKIVQSCPMPKQPEHGEYIRLNGQKIQPGTKLEVNCSYGYYNTGVRYTTCRSGRWSHLEPDVSQPFCKQITCIIPQPPAHCTVEFPQNAREIGLDSKISFKPENGYVLRGNNSYWTCKPNGTYGKWEGTLPECVEEIVCKLPSNPRNGGIRIQPGLERFVSGTWIIDTCNDGFYLQGDAERQCLPNGSWSFHSGTCVAKEPSINGLMIADITISAACLLGLVLMFFALCRIRSEFQTKEKEKDSHEKHPWIPFDDRANRYVHPHPQEPNREVTRSSRDDVSPRYNPRTERNNPVRQEFGNNNRS